MGLRNWYEETILPKMIGCACATGGKRSKNFPRPCRIRVSPFVVRVEGHSGSSIEGDRRCV